LEKVNGWILRVYRSGAGALFNARKYRGHNPSSHKGAFDSEIVELADRFQDAKPSGDFQ
jgi:hypothetical protein